MDNEQEISIDSNGVISGLTQDPAVETDGPEWDSPEATNPPAADSTSTSQDAGEDDAEGEPQPGDDALTEDEDEWSDTKPAAAKADPDDVPPEDRDPKGKVPSWRVREIREKADREITARDARIAELEAGRSTAPKPEARAAAPQGDAREQVIAHIAETDPVVKDCDGKLAAIAQLVEHAPEELVKYFRNADHMASEVARLTAIRETRVNTTLQQIERDADAEKTRAAEAQTQHVTKLVTDYDTAIKASKIPGIEKYVQRVASNAGKLNVGIRELIISAEDKDVVTAAIGSNRKLFDELAQIDPNKPMTAAQLAHVALKLGKAVAKYEMPKQSVVDDAPAPRAPSAPQPTATRRASRPTSAPKYKVERDGTIVM